MNTAQTRRPALQSQVSATVRFATAVAIAAILALAWIGAEQASHQAVQTATAAISRGAAPAAQPAVEVAGHREAAAAKRI
jgi:predicted aspartyl protease